MRAGSGNKTCDRERAKNTQSDGSYKIERTKLKISTMTSVGDLEESVFLHESVISFRSDVNHVYLAHALNKPCSRTGRKYVLNNNMRLITRCT